MENDQANGSELSEAQKLKQLHANSHYHSATVEDAQDDDAGPRIKGGVSPLQAESSAAAGAQQPMSEKAAGKQKESAASGSRPPLDTQSHELFPKLGPAKPVTQAQNPTVWTAKLGGGGSGPNGQTNGAGRSVRTAGVVGRKLRVKGMEIGGKRTELQRTECQRTERISVRRHKEPTLNLELGT